MSHQRMAASKTTQKFKPHELVEDDESNINSDEDIEYVDSQENYPVLRAPNGYNRPGTATGFHGST